MPVTDGQQERPSDDRFQPERPVGEECGVFGVWAPDEDVAKLTYYGMYALQHRGQEAAGMAVSDGSAVLVYKDLGLVAQVFDEAILSSLRGHLAIGHTRYSTTGAGHLGERAAVVPQPAHRRQPRARPQRQPDQHQRAGAAGRGAQRRAPTRWARRPTAT